MNKAFTFLIALILPTLTPFLFAQEDPPELSLSEAMDMGLARADFQERQKGRTALAESAVLREETWDNPQLYLSSESVDQAGTATDERYLLLSQRIELFGSKRLRGRAAKHQRNAVNLENHADRLAFMAEIKEGYFEVLYLQKRIEVLEDWENNTQNIGNVVALREEAGHASGYDRRRLSREAAEARTMTAGDRALHAAGWERLRGLLGLDRSYTLTGPLMPPLPEKEINLSQNPSLLAFDETVKAAELMAKAARHWKLPEFTAEAGIKETEFGGFTDRSIFVSARLPLPAFDRNQSSLMQARANALVARGEKSLAESRLLARVRALSRQIRQMHASIELYRTEAIDASKELVAIAELAYREGEMTLLALLDAYQSLRDARLHAVSMEAEARGLAIELERIGGEP